MKRRSLLSQRVQQATAGQQGHGTDAEGSLSREQDDAYHQAELMAKVQAMMKTAAEAEARERSSACTAPTVKEEQAEGESDSEKVDVDAEEAAEAEAMLAASMAALDAAEEDDKRVEEGFAPGVSAEEQESYLSWAYRRLTDLTAYEIPAMGSYSAEDDIMMGAEAAMAGAESAPTSAPASAPAAAPAEDPEETLVLDAPPGPLGIGLATGSHDYPKVCDLQPGSFSANNGVQVEDLLVAVNGKSTKGLACMHVTEMMFKAVEANEPRVLTFKKPPSDIPSSYFGSYASYVDYNSYASAADYAGYAASYVASSLEPVGELAVSAKEKAAAWRSWLYQKEKALRPPQLDAFISSAPDIYSLANTYAGDVGWDYFSRLSPEPGVTADAAPATEASTQLEAPSASEEPATPSARLSEKAWLEQQLAREDESDEEEDDVAADSGSTTRSTKPEPLRAPENVPRGLVSPVASAGSHSRIEATDTTVRALARAEEEAARIARENAEHDRALLEEEEAAAAEGVGARLANVYAAVVENTPSVASVSSFLGLTSAEHDAAFVLQKERELTEAKEAARVAHEMKKFNLAWRIADDDLEDQDQACLEKASTGSSSQITPSAPTSAYSAGAGAGTGSATNVSGAVAGATSHMRPRALLFPAMPNSANDAPKTQSFQLFPRGSNVADGQNKAFASAGRHASDPTDCPDVADESAPVTDDPGSTGVDDQSAIVDKNAPSFTIDWAEASASVPGSYAEYSSSDMDRFRRFFADPEKGPVRSVDADESSDDDLSIPLLPPETSHAQPTAGELRRRNVGLSSAQYIAETAERVEQEQLLAREQLAAVEAPKLVVAHADKVARVAKELETMREAHKVAEEARCAKAKAEMHLYQKVVVEAAAAAEAAHAGARALEAAAAAAAAEAHEAEEAATRAKAGYAEAEMKAVSTKAKVAERVATRSAKATKPATMFGAPTRRRIGRTSEEIMEDSAAEDNEVAEKMEAAKAAEEVPKAKAAAEEATLKASASKTRAGIAAEAAAKGMDSARLAQSRYEGTKATALAMERASHEAARIAKENEEAKEATKAAEVGPDPFGVVTPDGARDLWL